MQRQRQFEITKGVAETAPQMLGMGLDALFGNPVTNFKIADDQRVAALGNLNGIANVVAVAVGDQHKISRDAFRRGFGSRVAAQKWIHQQAITARFQPEGGVSKPGYFQAHLKNPPLVKLVILY